MPKKKKFKKWWKNHWDEVMLISLVLLAIFFILWGLKVI